MEILDTPDFIEDYKAPTNFKYANFGLRLLAFILDGLVLYVVNYIIESTFVPSTLNMLIGLNLLSISISWLYFATMESSETQGTLGKRAVGIKVTDMNGKRVSFGKATGRYFGKMLSGIILLIGYFMMLGNDKKQTLHDQMAGCLVLEK